MAPSQEKQECGNSAGLNCHTLVFLPSQSYPSSNTSHGNTEKQAQLRNFLERSRKELLDLISANSQSNETPKTDAPEVAQA